jgi:hypothetical protein
VGQPRRLLLRVPGDALHREARRDREHRGDEQLTDAYEAPAPQSTPRSSALRSIGSMGPGFPRAPTIEPMAACSRAVGYVGRYPIAAGQHPLRRRR